MASSDKMLAVTVAGGPRAIEVEKPKRKETSDVLIRVERIGICGTDWKMFDSYTDFKGIIGHEFAGTVVESDQYSWLRRRVTSSINLPADTKGFVDWKKAKHAADRQALGIRGRDGVMAEYVVLPEGILVALPDNVSFEEGAMAEPLAAAIDGVNCLPGNPGTVLVIGDGRLAQLTVRVLLWRGLDVDVWGHHQSKLDIMKKSGARVLNKEPEGNKYRSIMEISGSPSGFDLAMSAIQAEGTIVAESVFTHKYDIDISKVVVDELTIVGSRCGDISDAVKLISEGHIEVTDLISGIFPLSQADKAFARDREKDSIKVMLTTGNN